MAAGASLTVTMGNATEQNVRAKRTISQVQSLACIGSNHSWVRWWAHWNHPVNPCQMAISLMDETGKTVECRDLENQGFEKVTTQRGFIIYICDRVDEEGRPFVSRL